MLSLGKVWLAKNLLGSNIQKVGCRTVVLQLNSHDLAGVFNQVEVDRNLRDSKKPYVTNPTLEKRAMQKIALRIFYCNFIAEI